MNILHINSNYLLTRLHDEMIQELISLGINNRVYMAHHGGKDFVSDPRDYVCCPIVFNKRDRFFYHRKQSKILLGLYDNVNLQAIDVVHAHTLFTDGYAAYSLKRDRNIPYVVTVRNTDINIFFKHIIYLRKIGINILKDAEKVVFLSKTYRDLVIEKYIPGKLRQTILDKSKIIPNGIAEFWFQNRGIPKECPHKDDLKFIYAGTINKNKNLLETAKAIKILQQKGYIVRFTVVGRIEDKSICQKIANLPYVKYIAPKPREELINIYRSNDIFVMPSRHETFGLVYAEAMSQGTPVIYTKEQGFDGQFEEGEVGYSVEHNSSVDISSKIEMILNNYEEISKRCVERVDKFDWEKIGKEYLNIYENLLHLG